MTQFNFYFNTFDGSFDEEQPDYHFFYQNIKFTDKIYLFFKKNSLVIWSCQLYKSKMELVVPRI